MLKDTERVITTMQRAIKNAAITDDENKKAIFRAYAAIVNILNNCVETDYISCILDELESIEEDLAFVVSGANNVYN